MRHPRRIWLIFAGGAAVVLAAFGWITHLSLSLERRQQQAQAEARLQESMRLALWRMDSMLTPVLAQEAAKSYRMYSVFSATSQPATTFRFRLYFQMDAGGGITSPYLNTDLEQLNRLARIAPREWLTEQLVRAQPAWKNTFESNIAANIIPPQAQQARVEPQQQPGVPQQQAAMPQQEFQQRAQVVQMANQMPEPMPAETVSQSPLTSLWRIRDNEPAELFWVRRVQLGKRLIIQGIWTDWPAMKQRLLDSVRDLLPAADLVPAPEPQETQQASMLAAIPAMLEPGATAPVAATDLPRWTPTRITLGIGWLAMLAALLAVALVLRAAVELSERRGQFVSAVTHELRTPLTTFRMYSEMLAENMVPDEQNRREYLNTLTREAKRLADVVERILLYARVERSRAVAQRERIQACELIERVSSRLIERAREAGMDLVISTVDASDATLNVDVQAVEQILFNLVDNSCKYAKDAANRELILDAYTRGRKLELRYRDHGPGISAADARRIFSPFQRGARQQDHSTSGVGLGLAIARGLARELGGDLRLSDADNSGAAFVLTLPVA